MKKDKLKDIIKAQDKAIKKQYDIIKSYKKLLKEYDQMNQKLKKNIKNLGLLIEEIEIEEELTDEELDEFLKQFDSEELILDENEHLDDYEANAEDSIEDDLDLDSETTDEQTKL